MCMAHRMIDIPEWLGQRKPEFFLAGLSVNLIIADHKNHYNFIIVFSDNHTGILRYWHKNLRVLEDLHMQYALWSSHNYVWRNKSFNFYFEISYPWIFDILLWTCVFLNSCLNNKHLSKTHLHTLGKNAIDQCDNPEKLIAAGKRAYRGRLGKLAYQGVTELWQINDSFVVFLGGNSVGRRPINEIVARRRRRLQARSGSSPSSSPSQLSVCFTKETAMGCLILGSCRVP
jgi:hypothetical protein